MIHEGIYDKKISLYNYPENHLIVDVYEKVQSDIFDHIFAVVSEFQLRIFQEPSGADFQSINNSI